MVKLNNLESTNALGCMSLVSNSVEQMLVNVILDFEETLVHLLFGVGDLLSGLLLRASFVRVYARIFFKVKEMSQLFVFCFFWFLTLMHLCALCSSSN